MAVTAADARTVDQLLSVIRDGGQPEYLLFWGHQPPPGGGTGKGCLSQWWPAAFTVDGVRYPSAEHYMMAAKHGCPAMPNLPGRSWPPRTRTRPRRWARQVRRFDEQRWAEHHFDVVVAGNMARFGQHRQPGPRRGFPPPRNRVWSIGLATSDERAGSPERWSGLNLLGFALMKVRHRLRVQQAV